MSPWMVPRLASSAMAGSPHRTKTSHAKRVARGSSPCSRQRMMWP
jgi:hypothetical protein